MDYSVRTSGLKSNEVRESAGQPAVRLLRELGTSGRWRRITGTVPDKFALSKLVRDGLVMPQLDYIPLNVLEQLNRFEEAGGKILWIDDVPRAAEHAKNDEKVKLLLDFMRNKEQLSYLHLHQYTQQAQISLCLTKYSFRKETCLLRWF